MFGFFILNAIRRVTNEKTAAQVAYFIMKRVPHSRFIYRITDLAGLWLDLETSYRYCRECFKFVIEDGRPEYHAECYADFLRDSAEELRELEYADYADPSSMCCGYCGEKLDDEELTVGMHDTCEDDASDEADYNENYNGLIQ